MARTELRDHPKFRRLAHTLKLPTPYVLGLLECLWQTGYQSGSDFIGDSTDVELCSEWPGEPGVLTSALLACGWIDEADGKYCIHDLYDHAPEYAKKRMRARRAYREQTEAAQNGAEKRRKAQNGADSAKSARVPNPTQPNPTEGSKEPSTVCTVPDVLNTPAFLEAWENWLAYRRERKTKTTDRTKSAQLATLAAVGETSAIAAIEKSIRNGWQGLFPESNPPNDATSAKPKRINPFTQQPIED
jgi:hypothetical protein